MKMLPHSQVILRFRPHMRQNRESLRKILPHTQRGPSEYDQCSDRRELAAEERNVHRTGRRATEEQGYQGVDRRAAERDAKQ